MNLEYVLAKKLDVVISNIEIILRNKDRIINEIMLHDSLDDFDIYIEGLIPNSGSPARSFPGRFRTCVGLCANANLWALRHVDSFGSALDMIKGSNNQEFVASRLGKLFIDQYGYSESQLEEVSSSYPIYGDTQYASKWLNSIRWEFVEFCLEKLKEVRRAINTQ